MKNLILPRVRSLTETAGTWTPQRMIGFAVAENDPFGQNAFRAAELFLPDRYLVTDHQAQVTLRRLDAAPHAEWYRLTVTADGAVLEYADARGAVNAVASLAQLILAGPVPACVMEDWPEYSFRAVMLDLAHGRREPFQDVLDMIVHMALSKYNTVQINLLCEGLPYASDAVPELRGSRRDNARQYTKEQMRQLADLCQLFAMELIPMLQIPAHAGDILATFPQFACEVPEDHTSRWCLCPGSEGLFEMYEKLIAEVCELFPGRYLHMGGDELEFTLQPELNQLCYWRECPKCRALREHLGLKDIREQFYYVVMRIYEYAKANGRTLMMWNDQIDISQPCPLPKDILIHFWRVAGAGRGPIEGCSMEAFARQGYQIVNSFFPQTYIDFDFYLSEDKLCSWTPVSDPEICPEVQDLVLGGSMCAWAYGRRERRYYDHTIQPALPLFADRLWRSDPATYDGQYRAAVYRFMFGKPLTCDLYPVFDNIIPPRLEEGGAPLTHKPLAEIDDGLLAACVQELGQPGPGGLYQTLRLHYIKLLQSISLQKAEAAAPVINVDK